MEFRHIVFSELPHLVPFAEATPLRDVPLVRKVEVSNDGWFDSRDAEMKHLPMGIFRAVEFRRPLLCCSNSGSGELVGGSLTPHGVACVTKARLFSPQNTTAYARWVSLWLWSLVVVVFWKRGRCRLLKFVRQG